MSENEFSVVIFSRLCYNLAKCDGFLWIYHTKDTKSEENYNKCFW